MNKLEKHYWKANDLALKKVKKLALNVLNKDNEIDEFIMGMGTYFFTYKYGSHVPDHKYKKLNFFLMQWDSEFKLTGNPMRFRKDGIVTTDW